MRAASSLFAAIVFAAASAASATTTTTTNFVCTTASAGYVDNRFATTNAGWTIHDPGADSKLETAGCPYTYPLKLKNSTYIQSPSFSSGENIVKVVVGARVTNTARSVVVTPSPGTAQSSALTEKDTLQEREFVFDAKDGVSSVKIETPSGTGSSYIYYVVVVSERDDSGPVALAVPTGLEAASVTDSSIELSWNAVEHAEGYAVFTNDAVAASCIPPSTSTVLSGLVSDTVYAVAVQALADGEQYADSAVSAAIEVRTSLAGGLLRATLLEECFTNATAGWTSSSYFHSKLADAGIWTDLDGCTNMANAKSALLIGRANADGCAISPEVALTNVPAGMVSIAFETASYVGKTTSGSLSIVDADTGAVLLVVTNFSPVAIASDTTSAANVMSVAESGDRILVNDIPVPARFRLRFDSFKGTGANYQRLYLDSIKVTQVYDPNFAVLAAPTGLETNDIGKTSFGLTWNAVANAAGYEVLLDGISAVTSLVASATLTGLADGRTYSVQVKALGDNLHYGDSALSDAISVTTLADAQKIDFTVTGAPAGDVFAGDAVAFTVTAENEATHAAEPVSFSGIAGATFTAATGAFSWTPTEGDVGSHTATFASGDYSTNVTITVVSALKTETLKAEHFSKITSSSWTATAYTTQLDGDIGTWTGLDLVKTKAAVIIGRGDSSGNAVSPAVELKVRTPGSLSVSFDTGSLPDKTASIKASILDAADGRVVFEQTFVSLASLPSDATAVSDAGAHFTLAPGSSVALPAAVKVKFETIKSAGDNSQRAYVDTVVFQQTISARIRDLPAPTGLAVVGEPGETGFTVGWTAVTGATNYAVRVTDAAGAVVFSAPFCAATQATVTGLADDVTYAVQVRATGDEAACFASPWSDALAVRTARSATHPTMTFGEWQNAVGNGGLYAGLANVAAVSAVRDNGTNAVVTLASVQPAPAAGPTFEANVLSWIPADADTNKTFTISFLMDGTYTTNVSFKVLSVEPLLAPEVTANPVDWNAFGLSWNPQYRAAGYAVRVWTDCPNPAATTTRMEEYFPSYYKKGGNGNRPAGWIFNVTGAGYDNGTAPVQFSKDGNWMATYDLGGPISSVSFLVKGNSMADGSTLRAYWAGALSDAEMENKDNWTNHLVAAVSDLGNYDQTVTAQIPAEAGAHRIVWLYERHGGNVGVGSVVIEGTGFSTPRWLPGWGPAAKDVGLVQGCTVAKPRPGKVLGVNPANKKEDLTEDRINYAEVAVRDAAGATLATVVEVAVPAPPRSARATLLIFQ